MKNLLLFVLLISIVSCQKEEELIEFVQSPSSEAIERHERVFSDFQAEIEVSIGSQQMPGQEGISQSFKYRMLPYSSVDGAFFYKVIRKSQYHYVNGAHEVDWEETDGLYRYDYQKKLALHYEDVRDTSPEILMDFNLNLGDEFLLSASSNADFGDIYFVVDSIAEMQIDAQVYPQFYGHLKSNASNNGCGFDGKYLGYDLWLNYVKNTLMLCPYYPNPIQIDQNFDYYLKHDWTPENLGGENRSGVHANNFKYILRETGHQIAKSYYRIGTF